MQSPSVMWLRIFPALCHACPISYPGTWQFVSKFLSINSTQKGRQRKERERRREGEKRELERGNNAMNSAKGNCTLLGRQHLQNGLSEGLMEDSLYILLEEETARNHDAYVPDAGSNELFAVTKGPYVCSVKFPDVERFAIKSIQSFAC